MVVDKHAHERGQIALDITEHEMFQQPICNHLIGRVLTVPLFGQITVGVEAINGSDPRKHFRRGQWNALSSAFEAFFFSNLFFYYEAPPFFFSNMLGSCTRFDCRVASLKKFLVVFFDGCTCTRAREGGARKRYGNICNGWKSRASGGSLSPSITFVAT